ncbi:hypothetical protein CGCVW01_v010962, partial [Colletotrichum viniferum]
FFKFIIVLGEKAFILKFIDIILFFFNKLSKAITALKIATPISSYRGFSTILALKYFPVRVIRQLTRCASRRQTAKEQKLEGKKS